MAGKASAKLLVILSPEDSRKLLLPNGIPESVEELNDNVRKDCGLNGKFRLQYQDRDFGDAFVNLTQTGELDHFGTLKVIPLPDVEPSTTQAKSRCRHQRRVPLEVPLIKYLGEDVSCLIKEYPESHIPEEDKQMKVTWYTWEATGGLPNKVQKSGTLGDVLDSLKTAATQFLNHCFVKRNQSTFFQAKRKQSKTDKETVVLKVDFAENYTAAYQDQIQSAYWHQKQVTVFPSVLWSDGEPESYAIVSDSLEHDKRSVSTFLTKIVLDVREKHPAMRVMHIFSDGAASQFKNKFIWCFMSTTFKELFPTLKVQWHFATSHGKGAVDGVGATVKRAVNTDVLSRQAILVTDAASFADSAKKSCPNIKIKIHRNL
ncbi:unnamed protein product [Leuciscus chuanchicus]